MSRVPVIIQVPNNKNVIKLLSDRNKTIGKLMVWLRIHIKMESKQALFMLLKSGTLPANSSTVGEIYDEHKDPTDGKLYIFIKLENTFGCPT